MKYLRCLAHVLDRTDAEMLGDLSFSTNDVGHGKALSFSQTAAQSIRNNMQATVDYCPLVAVVLRFGECVGFCRIAVRLILAPVASGLRLPLLCNFAGRLGVPPSFFDSTLDRQPSRDYTTTPEFERIK